MQFTVKKIKNKFINTELKKIGFDPDYLDSAQKKHEFLNIKIEKVPFYCATIIKEAALSAGADAGVHRGVLNHSVEFSDVILSGTKKQLETVSHNLSKQPFGLKNVGDDISLLISGNKTYLPEIMGILNITEDSFSDGGQYLNPTSATEHAKKLVSDGATIIDIGAQATNPNSNEVDEKIEIERIQSIINEIKKLNVKISIDTRNSKVAEFALNHGADIINDVSGLEYDENMIKVIKNSTCQIVIMHSKGTPQNMDNLCVYDDVSDEVYNSLKSKTEFLIKNGVDKERIIIDVGFGFAKNIEQNIELLKRIDEFNSLGVKTLAGVSRKRFIKSVTCNPSFEDLDDITAISSFYLFENNIDIIRVHNVHKTKLALDFYNAIS